MKKKIIIGCSMRFRDLIKETMQKIDSLGYEALFPNIDYSPENRDVAASLEEKAKLAWDHYIALEEADAVYFIVPEGYMGTSCKIELGYALALKKPIYFSEKTNDWGLDSYITKTIPLEELELFQKEL